MRTTSSVPPPFPGRIPIGINRGALSSLIMIGLMMAGFIWFWYWWRIEPGPDRIAVLIRKTGKDLPSGEIIALQPDQKGIQLEVLAEGGRYFCNPYTWGRKYVNLLDVPPGKMAVLTRLYGRDLLPGRILAEAEEKGVIPEKGIVREVLMPGKHRVNPFAYSHRIEPALNIEAGCVGVKVSLEGRDPLNSELTPEQKNTFLVTEGLKGVMPGVLYPGTHFVNPYEFVVNIVNLQSQRFEMSGEDAITFLTLDGFTVIVEGTIEYAVLENKSAILTHQVGDQEDIIKKIVLPRARGFSRIEGSKNPAISYIVGETRQQFQDKLDLHLKEQCKTWGVEVRSVLVRNIKVPDEIASIIRDREVAFQNAKKFDQQIEQAKSKAELTRQEMLAVQNKDKVDAETVRIQAIIKARQEQSVLVIAAEKDLEVARIENEAASFQTNAIMLKAEAERSVIEMNNKAQARVFGDQVKAFGSGMNFARYAFYVQMAPRIASVLSGDDSEGLGALFAPYLPTRTPHKEVTP